MPAFAGLQTNLLTWVIVTAMIAVWMISVRLVPGWVSEGWPSLLKSLYGFVWLDFGLDILLRFVMLSYNAVEWANQSPRLLAESVATVNATLAYCGLFWLMVAAGYRLAVRRRSAGPFAITRTFTPDLAYAVALPAALLCSALFYLLDTPNSVPLALLTPLSGVAYLYVVPAVIVWWDHFRRPEPWWRVGGVQLVMLLPPLVNGWRSPYRENLAPVFLIPLLAALFAGRRPKLRVLVPAGLVCFLVLTTFVSAYRSIKWENARPEEVAGEMRSASLVDWFTGNWGEQLSRFHGFDSMLLTVQLVPAARPYSERSVLVAPFVRDLCPGFSIAVKRRRMQGKNLTRKFLRLTIRRPATMAWRRLLLRCRAISTNRAACWTFCWEGCSGALWWGWWTGGKVICRYLLPPLSRRWWLRTALCPWNGTLTIRWQRSFRHFWL